MKVILVNGSPKSNGCTYTALKEVSKELTKEGIETEVFQLGNEPIMGCIGCRVCKQTGRCFKEDLVNEFLDKIDDADGFVFGTPVHYAGASGSITSFLDRVFYSAGNRFDYKPGAAIVSCRRGGATAAFDQMNKYFTISNMPIVSSQYWNMVHGNSPEEVLQDLEGLQTMRTLGKNMAWLLKCIDSGKKQNVAYPEKEKIQRTNFVR
ncbi:multimeric flavodoxin WrbA [Breznakia sp. PF5-3]|uniref:flavodoxin family protein n=1 Tax=unclassified Breznakia TaxID=2623764 RepID=UPI00240493ED|nr:MULTISPECIES: flavodoxin family protein [unclassified Breznakia]MDF9825425.1 multimeric flavodoxin WrbA [Breznakia sp. PM6-1]MDF9836303.1 multimeric flavodoxin WrbA [Breznakia sp. PF5-3]MDF9838925.1 multimeric flavodoxin WrbA [Breznakia sp. PFB2-8]MDF9860951.1 multimeric flavodoxin WrbA [Breznakia sp. PH5-24]